MKKTIYYLAILFGLLLTGCSNSKDVINPEITLKSQSNITLNSNTPAQQIITFVSTLEWETTSTNDDWFNYTPKKGNPGTNNITVSAKESNNSGNPRTGVITIISQGVSQQITITQNTNNLIQTTQTEYKIAQTGGNLDLSFITNLPYEGINFETSASWIKRVSSTSRGLDRYTLTVTVTENGERNDRTASLYLKDTTTGTTSEEIKIVQYAASRESTDYSADGTVYQLQQATIGAGVPVVIMGDAFLDVDIADGTYRKVMEKAMENIFTEEPMKSLRAYFNIYAVNAVSKHDVFGDRYETAFSCTLAGGGSTGISGDHNKCIEYANKVPNIDLHETLIITILNTNAYAGTAYFGFQANSRIVELGIGYCPIIDNLESESFRQVLVHETTGHAFAKLLDEYSYTSQGTMPEEQKSSIRYYHNTLGWAMNIDIVSDPESVVWADFIKDNRFSWENLGVYEGAGTYIKEAYRPTNKSMMNANDTPFNTPSREAIYKRIMKVAYGEAFEYNYETFVAFDQSYHDALKAQSRTSRSNSSNNLPRFAPPVMVNRPIPALK